MVFINNAIFDLLMKEVLKGAYVRILKEYFQKMILMKELKVCPYKRCGHQVHSTYVKKKEISDLTRRSSLLFHPLQEDVFQYFVSNYDMFCATQASAFPTFALLQPFGVYFITLY